MGLQVPVNKLAIYDSIIGLLSCYYLGVTTICLPVGVVDALTKMSQADNPVTQTNCSVALAHLSSHAKLNLGSVSALVRLFKAQDKEEITK